jgi:hypothetical protein
MCHRGLKTYLSKWKGKGFDQDMKKLSGMLEAGDIAHAQLLVLFVFIEDASLKLLYGLSCLFIPMH